MSGYRILPTVSPSRSTSHRAFRAVSGLLHGLRIRYEAKMSFFLDDGAARTVQVIDALVLHRGPLMMIELHVAERAPQPDLEGANSTTMAITRRLFQPDWRAKIPTIRRAERPTHHPTPEVSWAPPSLHRPRHHILRRVPDEWQRRRRCWLLRHARVLQARGRYNSPNLKSWGCSQSASGSAVRLSAGRMPMYASPDGALYHPSGF